jgi:polar amino acid transport system substrate-binding protein
MQGYVATNPEIEFHVIASDAPSGAAIAFPKGSTRVEAFNKVLQKMKASGELEQLAKKWFATGASASASPAVVSPTASPK